MIVALQVILALATSGTANATDSDQAGAPAIASLKTLSLEDLGNIEVTTAAKEPETLRRVPAAVYVITQEEIRRSGATSLPEILRLAPGVDVSRIDSDHWSVGVRGFGDQFSKSVLVLMDGRSIYTPLFAGVMWAVQDAVVDDIDRIEVIRGPGGTIWGANAVDGVINIITKSAKNTRGVLATVGSGNVDRGIAGVRYGGGSGSLDYRVYLRGFTRGPEFHGDGTSFDDWRQGQGGFRTDWTHGRDSATIQGDIYKGRDGQSVSLGSISPPSQTLDYVPVDVSGGNILTHWRHEFGRGDVQLQAYFDRTHLLGPQIGENRDTFDVDFIHHWVGLRRQNLTWGVGARRSPSHIIQTVPTLDIVPHDQTDALYSAFAQDEVTVVEKKLWFTMGAKLEHNNYTGFEIQPSGRLLWTPTTSQSAWLAVTRAVRTPSTLEEAFQYTVFLTSTPLNEFLKVVGNSAFQSERRVSYEAGYRSALTSSLYVDVSAFHNDVDNLESLGAFSATVETSPAPAYLVLTLPYENGVKGRSDGVEVVTNWKPASRWENSVSYSYLHIDVKNKPGNTDTSSVATYEGSSPRHQVRVQSRLDLPRGWGTDVTFRYVSALPARNVDAYSTADLRVGQQLSDTFEWSVAGQNLLQPHHVEFGHDPGPVVALRRSVFASITWRH
jgi:iron complex outermembrane receptor protein